MKHKILIALLSATCLTAVSTSAMAAPCSVTITGVQGGCSVDNTNGTTITSSGTISTNTLDAISAINGPVNGDINIDGQIYMYGAMQFAVYFENVSDTHDINIGGAGTINNNGVENSINITTNSTLNDITNNGLISTSMGFAVSISGGSTIHDIINNKEMNGNNAISINNGVVNSITNSATGSINGFFGGGANSGIIGTGTGGVTNGITNAGTIYTTSHAINFASGSSLGGVENQAGGEIISDNGRGISVESGGVLSGDINNYGSITASEGIYLHDSTLNNNDVYNRAGGSIDTGSFGISVRNGSIGNLTNDGTINSAGFRGVSLDNVTMTGSFTNTGTISSGANAAVYITGTDVTVYNSGTLNSGINYALLIDDSPTASTVYNSGILNGRVSLEDTDIYFNPGSQLNGDLENPGGDGIAQINTNLISNSNFQYGTVNMGADDTLTLNFFVDVGAMNNKDTNSRINFYHTNYVSNMNEYTQLTGTTMGLKVDSPTTYSKLVIADSLFIDDGATIDFDASAATGLAAGQILTDIIEVDSGGTLFANTGTFIVTDNSFLYNFSLIQHSLSIDAMLIQQATIEDAANNKDAGRALDDIVANDTDLAAAFAALGSSQEVSNAVSQTLPTTNIAGPLAVINTLNMVGNVVQSRTEGDKGLSSGDMMTNGHFWMKPFASKADGDTSGTTSGFDSDSYGTIFGADGIMDDDARVGVAVIYANTDVDGKDIDSGQNVSIDTYQATIYGSYNIAPNTDANAQLGFGYNKNDSKRFIALTGDTAEANYDSWNFRVGGGVGRNYNLGSDTTITPSARIDYTMVASEGYDESGAGVLNLNVDSKTTDELIPMVEAKLSHNIDQDLSLTANAGIGYNMLDNDNILTSSYAGGGAAFQSTGFDSSPWIVKSGIGVNYAANDSLDLAVHYDRENRGTDYDNQMVSVKARLPF